MKFRSYFPIFLFSDFYHTVYRYVKFLSLATCYVTLQQVFGNIGKERGEKVVEEANKDGDHLGRKPPVAREVIENEAAVSILFSPFLWKLLRN